MLQVLGHAFDGRAHLFEDGNGGAIIDVALEEQGELAARVGARNEVQEQGRQLVVEQNEFTPDVHATSDGALVPGEGLGAQVVAGQRGDDGAGGAPGGLHSDADAGGEYRVHEAGGVSDEDPSAAGKAVHHV